MTLAIRLINTALILFAVFMGIKQVWAMVSGKEEMVDMFGKWNIGRTGWIIIGGFTILPLLVILPSTFLWGNFITAAGMLFIITLHLQDKDLKGVAIELPFFLMSLVSIYLQHPLAKTAESV